VFNTWTGLTWVVGYALVLLWVVSSIARILAGRLRRRRRGPRPPEMGDDLGRQGRRALGWWGWIGFRLLLIQPLAFQIGWQVSNRGTPDWWAVITFYPEPPHVPGASGLDAEKKRENDVFQVFDILVRLTIGTFALVSFVLLTSSDVRRLLLPGLELALDVLNYLPPRRYIDASAVTRFLLGGRRSS
jgi:hypothetical protein